MHSIHYSTASTKIFFSKLSTIWGLQWFKTDFLASLSIDNEMFENLSYGDLIAIFTEGNTKFLNCCVFIC